MRKVMATVIGDEPGNVETSLAWLELYKDFEGCGLFNVLHGIWRMTGK